MSIRHTIHLYLFFTAVAAVMTGFLLSRSLLSSGLILMIANGFLQPDWKERVKTFFENHFAAGISALFLLPLISGLWSEDTGEWINRCRIQLPLLLLPFSMVIQKGVEKKHFVLLSVFWIVLLFAGSAWSIAQYISDVNLFHSLYHRSKVIPVPADDDHIRFSIAIIIAILLWLKIIEWKYFQLAVIKITGSAIILWLVVFLHITGVKTGLLGFYMIVLPVLFLQLWAAGKKTIVFLLVLAGFSMPFIAYKAFPTFRARAQYVVMDWQHWSKENYTGNFSDGNRILTMRAGLDIVKNNFLTGVGYGDIKKRVSSWFDKNAPHIPVTERYLPLNQWLTTGSATGIAGMLLFSAVILLPFFSRQWLQNKHAASFICYMSIIFMYECTIEDQFGVFIFSFFSMWWNTCNRLKD
jgi:hypothetical protein